MPEPEPEPELVELSLDPARRRSVANMYAETDAAFGALLEEPARLRAMGDEARKLRRLDAAEAILADVDREISGAAPRTVGAPAEVAVRAPQRRGGVA